MAQLVVIKTKNVSINSKSYAYDETTGNLYDKESIVNKNPFLVGKLKKEVDGKFKIELL